MNTSVYLTDTDTDTDTELSKDNNKEENKKEEEEEDMRVREGKTEDEALSLDSFCQVWNDSVAKARRTRDAVPMKSIRKADLPTDAQERIAKALKGIGAWLDDQTVEKVCQTCHLPPDRTSREDIAKWYMVIALNKYGKVTMKPRDSSFGSFNWFVNDPKRIRKLFDGDIQ